MPFYLRTGKRLARKITEIAVTLKPVPHLAFQSIGSVGVQANQMILTVQPDEGVSVSLGAKIPGPRMRIRPVNMEFRYGTSFMSESPEAYERLILDAMRGDATLFTRNDEIEALWGIIDPILDRLARGHDVADPAVPGRVGRAAGGRRAARTAARQSLAAAVSEDVWSERDTNPDAIEAALRELLRERHAANQALAPARVLNLVVIVDRAWKGEIANRLERVGRYHASRTILCAVEEGRDDARRGRGHELRGAGRRRHRRDPRAGRDRHGPRAPERARDDRRPGARVRAADGAVVRRTATTRRSRALRGMIDVMLLDSDDLPDAADGARARAG